jgi:hypothetical protein
LFVEFSTGRGARPDPRALIGRVPVDRVVAGITAPRGVVDEQAVAPGVDFLDRPDPRIARLVAHWPHPRTSRKDPR